MTAKPSTDLANMKDYLVAMHEQLSDGSLGTGVDVLQDKKVFGLNSAINMADFIEASWLSGSPFQNAYAYDPTDDLDAYEEAITLLSDEKAVEDALTQWQSNIAAVDTAANTYFHDTAEIATRVAAFETAQEVPHAAAINRVCAPIMDQLSPNRPSMLMSLVSLERGRASASAEYAVRLQEMQEQARLNVLASAPLALIDRDNQSFEQQKALLQFKDALTRLKIVAMREFYAEDLELGFKDQTWDMNLILNYGLPTLGVLGSPVTEKGPSKTATAISTGLTVASTAVQMGLGPAGTAIAGIGGALASAFL